MQRKSVIATQGLSDVNLYSIHTVERDSNVIVERSFLIDADELKEVWGNYPDTDNTFYRIWHFNTSLYVDLKDIT